MARNSSIQHPLTTLFTPPSDCNNMQFRSGDWGRSFFFVPEHQQCQRTCYPRQNYDPSFTSVYGIFYSPGLLCPSGHTTAGLFFRDGTAATGLYVVSSRTWRLSDLTSSSVAALVSLYPMSTLAVGETGAFCCLSGYELDPYSLPYCWRTITTPTTIGVYGCSGHGGGSAYHFATTTTIITLASNVPFKLSKTITGDNTESFATLSTTSPIFMHYVVQLQWQASDLSSVPSTSSMASATTSQTFQSTQVSPSNSSAETNTLSAGAKIGIGVSASIAGLLAVILIALLIRWYRWKRLGPQAHNPSDIRSERVPVASSIVAASAFPSPTSLTSVNTPYQGGYQMPTYPRPGWVEHDGRPVEQRIELGDGIPRVELGGYRRSELEGRWNWGAGGHISGR